MTVTINDQRAKRKCLARWHKKWADIPSATTFYPCCVSALGRFKGSWMYAAQRKDKELF